MPMRKIETAPDGHRKRPLDDFFSRPPAAGPSRRPAPPLRMPRRSSRASLVSAVKPLPSSSKSARTYLSEVQGRQVLVTDLCESDNEGSLVTTPAVVSPTIIDDSTMPSLSQIDWGFIPTAPVAAAESKYIDKTSIPKKAYDSKENVPERPAYSAAMWRTPSKELKGAFGAHSKRPKTPAYKSVPASKRKSTVLGASVSLSSLGSRYSRSRKSSHGISSQVFVVGSSELAREILTTQVSPTPDILDASSTKSLLLLETSERPTQTVHLVDHSLLEGEPTSGWSSPFTPPLPSQDALPASWRSESPRLYGPQSISLLDSPAGDNLQADQPLLTEFDTVQGSQKSIVYTSAEMTPRKTTVASQSLMPRIDGPRGKSATGQPLSPSLPSSGRRATPTPSSVTPRKRSSATRPFLCSSPVKHLVISPDAKHCPTEPRISIADILRNAQAEEVVKQAARQEEQEARRKRLAELEDTDEEEEEQLEDLSAAFVIEAEPQQSDPAKECPARRTTRLRTTSADLHHPVSAHCKPAQDVGTSAVNRFWRQLRRDEASVLNTEATQRALKAMARMDDDDYPVRSADMPYPTPDSNAEVSDDEETDLETLDLPSLRARFFKDEDMDLDYLEEAKISRRRVGLKDAGETAHPQFPVWGSFWKRKGDMDTSLTERFPLMLEGDVALTDFIRKAAEEEDLTVISALLFGGTMQSLLQSGANAISFGQWLLRQISRSADSTEYIVIATMICFIFSRSASHPFKDSTALLSSILFVFSSMGAQDDIVQQSSMLASFLGDRQSACVALCQVIDSGVENGWLLSLEAQSLAPKLLLLACDHTTSTPLRGAIDDTMSKIWPLCLLQNSAVSIALKLRSALAPYPSSVQRQSVLAVARRTDEAREIGRCFGLAFLVGDRIQSISEDEIRLVPDCSLLRHAVQSIAIELAKQPVDNEHIADLVVMLIEAMSDIDALVNLCPTMQADQHEVQKLKAMVLRTAHLINVQPGQYPEAVRNKSTLLQLGTALKIKLAVALQRRARKHREKLKHLSEGENGQLRLLFGTTALGSE